MNYLGFRVSAAGTRPQAEKVTALTSMICEDMGFDPSAAARFAGMIGHYHRYLQDLHSILAPFHELKQKGADARHIMMSLRFKSSFAHAVYLLATATALARPDYSKPFYIDVDMASSTGAGAILSQRHITDDPDSHVVLAFWSRRFSSEERRYGVRDQELLGLVDALENWRQYCVGTHVIIRTDHKSLEFLLRTRHREGTRASGFALKVQGYDVHIEYNPGKLHVGPDCMSRGISRYVKEGEAQGTLSDRPDIAERLRDAVGTSVASIFIALIDTLFDSPSSLSLHVSPAPATSIPMTVRPIINRSPSRPYQMGRSRAAARRRRDRELASLLSPHPDTVTPSMEPPLPSVVASSLLARDTPTTSAHTLYLLLLCYDSRGSLRVLLQQNESGHLFLPSAHLTRSLLHPRPVLRNLFHSHLLRSFPSPSSSFVADSLLSTPSLNVRHHLGPRLFITKAASSYAFQRLDCSDGTVASFFPADLATLRSLHTSLDRTLAAYFCFHYVSHAPPSSGTPSRRLTSRHSDLFRSFISGGHSTHVALTETHSPPPCLADCPCGPALISSADDAVSAASRLESRLLSHPGLCLGADLEGPRLGAGGTICLLQVTVDGVSSDEPPLTYVFDMLSCGPVCFHPSAALTRLFADVAIPKVFHCCWGDVAALYRGYNIITRCVFDTSIADSLCLRAHPNSQRGLASVLYDWLGRDVVSLTHKGSFVHTDDTWFTRPLPSSFFVYAYEDTLYLGRLYRRLSSHLRDLGSLDLCFSLSQQRAPPLSLPPRHPSAAAPTHVAVAVTDSSSRLLCLQSLSCGTYSLPCLPLPRTSSFTPDLSKTFAGALWSRVMGPPPKRLRASVSVSRLKRGVRVGDVLLYCAITGDLLDLLPALASAFAAAIAIDSLPSPNSRRLSLVSCTSLPLGSVYCAQRSVFQYIRSLAIAKEVLRNGVTDIFHSSSICSLHISLSLSVTALGVSAQLLPCILPPCPSSVGTISVTATTTPSAPLCLRASVILHDASFVYTLVCSDGGLTFPSYPLEEDCTPAESAAKAFDLYAGVSLRKYPGVNAIATRILMPEACRFIAAAEANAVDLGVHGNVHFFSWALPDGQTHPYLGQLHLADHVAAFYASRRLVNGFEMVSTKASRTPSFRLCRISDALPLLPPFARSALTSSVTRTSDLHVPAMLCLNTAMPPERLCRDVSYPIDDLLSSHHKCYASPPVDDSSSPVTPVSQHSDHPTSFYSPPDSELAALETAATALIYHNLASGATASAFASPSPPIVTRRAIRDEQLAHPGTAPLFEMLSSPSSHPPLSPFEQLLEVSPDGVLQIRATGPHTLPRALIPPRLQRSILTLYHDFNNHFGVRKVLPLLLHRFHWGSDTDMRSSLSDHIRHCYVCSRSKIPRFVAGCSQASTNEGSHPNDLLSGDVFEVGLVYDDYSHTLDFACHFTRGIRSTAVVGMPTSEVIANIIITVIIRYGGKPREIRSDRGSNFISAAIRLLARYYRWRITAGVSHSHNFIALVERWHSTLKQLLLSQRAAGADDNWPSRLPLMELAYNAAVNATTGYSPFFIDHLRHCVLPMDAMIGDPPPPDDLPTWVSRTLEDARVVYDAQLRALRLNSLNAKKRLDLKRDLTFSFSPGDTVLLARGELSDKSPLAKMTLPTDGPFTVARRCPNDFYVLTNLHGRRIHNVVHARRLIPCPQRRPEDHEWMVTDPRSGGLFPVHSISGRREAPDKPGEVEYRVHWLGLGSQYDKWLDVSFLTPIFHLVDLYNKRHSPLHPVPPLPLEPLPTELLTSPAGPHVKRKTFRYHPAPRTVTNSESLPSGPASTPSPIPSDPSDTPSLPTAPALPPSDLPVYGPPLPDTSDRFPVGTRVDTHFADSVWTGTVVRSRVYNPRTARTLPERLIEVVYDDPRYKGERWTHGLTSSDIRLHQPSGSPHPVSTRRSPRLVSTLGSDKPVVYTSLCHSPPESDFLFLPSPPPSPPSEESSPRLSGVFGQRFSDYFFTSYICSYLPSFSWFRSH